jgi:hypothetical protein
MALVVLSIASAGRADPAQISVSIDCAAVDDEGRAALEARARADLLVGPYHDGSLSISCHEGMGRVVWSRAGGQVRTRLRLLPRDRPGIVDGLLEDMHVVLSEDALEDESAAPAVPPAIVSPGPAAVLTLDGDRDKVAVEATSSRALPPVRFAASVHSELWSGAIGAAVGARAGLGIRLTGPWRLSLVGGPSWGTTSARDLRAWSLSTALTLDRDIGPQLDIGAGVVGSVLWANGSPHAFTEGQLEGETAGALLRAAYRAAVGPIELSIGPELEGLLRPVIVQVSGQEVFRLPTLVAGLDLCAVSR